MKKTLVWRFDDDVDRMPMQAVRVVARTATMRDFGEFQRLTRLATEIWEQKFPLLDEQPAAQRAAAAGEDGGEGAEAAEKPKQARADGAGVYLDTYRRWARLAAATAMVEVLGAGQEQPPVSGRGRKAQPASVEIDWDAPQDTWPWSPSSMSALGWDNPDSVMDLPTDFFFAWEQAVLDVNPGVWGAARTSDAPNAKKKTGLVAIY